MHDVYTTLKTAAEAEIVEKRSRFIAAVFPVSSEDEAVARLEEIRKKHRDARHNIFAYIIEENGLERCGDDGEPAGTAGVPVLNVLKREGLSNVIAVVTRYFGGILLGTGGLARAYSKAAKDALEAAGRREMTLCRNVRVKCAYTLLGKIENELSSFRVIRGETAYAEDAELSVFIPCGDAARFCERITDITDAKAKTALGDTEYKDFAGK